MPNKHTCIDCAFEHVPIDRHPCSQCFDTSTYEWFLTKDKDKWHKKPTKERLEKLEYSVGER
jgi:hypothetical protein